MSFAAFLAGSKGNNDHAVGKVRRRGVEGVGRVPRSKESVKACLLCSISSGRRRGERQLVDPKRKEDAGKEFLNLRLNLLNLNRAGGRMASQAAQQTVAPPGDQLRPSRNVAQLVAVYGRCSR
jgi:hypothetical protein